MTPNDRPSDRNAARSSSDASVAEPPRDPERADNLAGADDRGGSRDGERAEPVDAGDRDQLDHDDGRDAMK